MLKAVCNTLSALEMDHVTLDLPIKREREKKNRQRKIYKQRSIDEDILKTKQQQIKYTEVNREKRHEKRTKKYVCSLSHVVKPTSKLRSYSKSLHFNHKCININLLYSTSKSIHIVCTLGGLGEHLHKMD